MNTNISKLIKIDNTTTKGCTYEQIVSIYKPLINSLVQTWSLLDKDDVTQTCYIGLWKAFQTYDITKNITFGFYAKKIIFNDIAQLGKVHKKHNCCSLNSTTSESNSEYIDTVLDSNTDYNTIENAIVFKIFINNYLKYFCVEYKKLFNLHFEKGYTQKQISQIFKLTQPAISYKLKELMNMLRKCYKLNTIADYLPPKLKEKIILFYINDDLYGYIKKTSINKLYLTKKELSKFFTNIRNVKDQSICIECIEWLRTLYEEINKYIETVETAIEPIIDIKPIATIGYENKETIQQISFFSMDKDMFI